jgi:hypothetical protein
MGERTQRAVAGFPRRVTPERAARTLAGNTEKNTMRAYPARISLGKHQTNSTCDLAEAGEIHQGAGPGKRGRDHADKILSHPSKMRAGGEEKHGRERTARGRFARSPAIGAPTLRRRDIPAGMRKEQSYGHGASPDYSCRLVHTITLNASNNSRNWPQVHEPRSMNCWRDCSAICGIEGHNSGRSTQNGVRGGRSLFPV